MLYWPNRVKDQRVNRSLIAANMDYIFEDELFEVGAEIDAYCTRCRSNTPHTIIDKFEDEIRTVLCTICNTSHPYYPPQEDDERELRQPSRKGKRLISQKISWKSIIQQAEQGVVKSYSPKEKYKVGQLIDHPKFGLGYVKETISDTKIDAIFQDGSKILVYNRADIKIPDKPKKECEPSLAKPSKTSKPTVHQDIIDHQNSKLPAAKKHAPHPRLLKDAKDVQKTAKAKSERMANTRLKPSKATKPSKSEKKSTSVSLKKRSVPSAPKAKADVTKRSQKSGLGLKNITKKKLAKPSARKR